MLVIPTIVLLFAGIVAFTASFGVKEDVKRDRYWLISEALLFTCALVGIVGMIVG